MENLYFCSLSSSGDDDEDVDVVVYVRNSGEMYLEVNSWMVRWLVRSTSGRELSVTS